ncbi:MAG: AMP-binding protein, partial [Candidatus Acidiferrales bacterium]
MTMPASLEDQVPEILKNLPTRIGEIVKPWAVRLPGHPALVEASGVWTYGELVAAMDEAQSWLEGLGIRPGDRVMLVCENCRAFVAILLAITNLDAWPVLVSARLSAREIDQIQEHSGARRVIYMTGVSPQAAQHAKRHGAAIAEVAKLGKIGVGALNE